MTHTKTPWIRDRDQFLNNFDQKIVGINYGTHDDILFVEYAVNNIERVEKERDSFNKEAYEFRVLYNNLKTSHDDLLEAAKNILDELKEYESDYIDPDDYKRYLDRTKKLEQAIAKV